MEKTISDTDDFICINYPGIVKNECNLIQSFGGINTLSEPSHKHVNLFMYAVPPPHTGLSHWPLHIYFTSGQHCGRPIVTVFSEVAVICKAVIQMQNDLGKEALCDPKNKKLQLWFRPQDRLCRPATATLTNSNSILLKVKIRKRDRKVMSYNIVGQVQKEYRFASLCDFQYLGLNNGMNVYDKIIPTSLNPKWLEKDGPLVLIPNEFTRSDNIQGYYFFNKKSVESESKDNLEVIATSRRKRFGLAIFVGFEDPGVPTRPKESLDPQKLAAQTKELEILKEVLDKRPVVTKSAVGGLSGLSSQTLRDLMPYVAYHFHNGPWRANWVRYGYDPRQDPAARFYQTLDFRFLSRDQDDIIASKLRRSKRLPRTPTFNAGKQTGAITDVYILKPGRLPPCRQFFYQFCDIEIPEVKAVIESVEIRSKCDAANGWFPEGTAHACRRIIREYVLDIINNMKADEGDSSLCLDAYLGSSDGDQESNDSDDE